MDIEQLILDEMEKINNNSELDYKQKLEKLNELEKVIVATKQMEEINKNYSMSKIEKARKIQEIEPTINDFIKKTKR